MMIYILADIIVAGVELHCTSTDYYIVQRHSNKYETNCSNCSKSTKIGTHVH